MCVTVFASQPSVSIDTDTTHRTFPPNWPPLPTVFHHLAQQLGIRDVFSRHPIAVAHDLFLFEPRNFICRVLSEVAVDTFAGFQLSTVDQDRVRRRKSIAGVIEIPEKSEAAILETRVTVGVLSLEARNVVMHQLLSWRCCCTQR